MGQPKKDLDVRMDTTEVSKYLDSLRSKLTKQQLTDIDDVVDTIKSRVIKAIETDSLLELNCLKKNTTLKKLTDEAHKSMPDAPRDLFIRKLHFVMNAFQNRIEPRIKLLKSRKQQSATCTKVAGNAMDPPPQSPIAMATSTPLPSQNGNTGATEDSGDATIVEPTQQFSGASSPCTPISSQDGVHSAASQESSGSIDVGHPTHTDVATQTGPSTTCIPTCKYPDTGAAPSVKGKGSWLRCILCMKWCHAECCGEDGKYEGAFACFDCRSMSSQLTDIRDVLQEVTSQLAALRATVEGSTSKQVAHSPQTATNAPPQPVHPPTQHSAHPSHVYADVVINPQVPLHNTFDALHDSKEEDEVSPAASNEADTMPGPPCNQEAWLEAKAAKHKKKKAAKKAQSNTACQPTRVTILTDSILRNVDVKRTESLCGEGQCKMTFMRSAGNIGSAVDCIQRDAIPRTEPVVIHTGTNHVEDEIPKKTIDRFERLATNLRAQKYERVALSSIVYRRSFSTRTRNRIQTINTALSELCTKNQWVFIDNDNVDESCLLHGDKAHTNKCGDERLSHNLAKGIKELLKPRLNK
jgi:hypothetical protein